MPFIPARARRATLARRLALVAAVLAVLAAAPPAPAADNLTNGVLLDGSVVKVGVYRGGVISGRFSDQQSTFYCCSDTGISFFNGQHLALHVGGVAYDGNQFTPVSGPTLTGAGTASSPWLATTVFDAGASGLRVTHVVRAVDGSRAIRETFTVENRGGATVPYELFLANDLYVSGSDSGAGALEVGPPRALSGVANDGTKVSFVEITPWTHYFEGFWFTAIAPWNSIPFTYADTYDSAIIDNGLGVEWSDQTLAAGASAVFSIQERFSVTGGTLPQVPVFTAEPLDGTDATASIAFAPTSGDAAAAAFECRLDGALFDICTTPTALTGLAVGMHAFDVRALNIDGDTGPVATTTWTVAAAPPPPPPGDTTAPAAPAILDAPPASTSARTASVAFAGEDGAAFACRLDGGAWLPCTSPRQLADLGSGDHVLEVRQTDLAGNTGPGASVAWRVVEEPTAPPTPPRTPTPTPTPTPTRARVAAPATTVAATPTTAVAGCAMDGGAVAACRVTLLGPGGAVLGTGFVRVSGEGRQRVAVTIRLNARGRQLANRPGGVAATLVASILPAGGRTAMRVRTTTRLVPPHVVVVPTDLTFPFAGHRLTTRGAAYVASLRPKLAGARRVACLGYTDSTGSDAYNLRLGLRRAEAVCARLSPGLALSTRAVGIGERRPLVSNVTAEGRALNRRVELRIDYR